MSTSAIKKSIGGAGLKALRTADNNWDKWRCDQKGHTLVEAGYDIVFWEESVGVR